MKSQIRQNPDTGKWEIHDPRLDDVDCYIALSNRSQFAVVDTAEAAERFLIEEGVGGSIFAITHYDHNDETLPRSIFYKEVEAA